MEIFARGEPRFNTNHHRTFAEIHNMAEKRGFVGKEILFDNKDHRTFSDFKSHIIASSELIDRYLSDYLPRYYYTFAEPQQNEKPAAYYFMEEVAKDHALPPAGDMDSFLEKCCKMFKDTRNKGNAFMVDMKPDNFVYGHISNQSPPKTYFIDMYPTYFNANLGVFYMKASELAKIYGYKNFPKTHKIINDLSNVNS